MRQHPTRAPIGDTAKQRGSVFVITDIRHFSLVSSDTEAGGREVGWTAKETSVTHDSSVFRALRGFLWAGKTCSVNRATFIKALPPWRPFAGTPTR